MKQERDRVRIYPATAEDIPVIQRQCYELMTYVKQWSKTLKPEWVKSASGLAYFEECITDPRATLLKASLLKDTDDDEIAGFAAGFYRIDSKPYREERRFADLDFFYVDPAFRRHGVGKALVQGFTDWCKSNQVDVIRVETTYGNKEAKAFYQKMGFSPYEVVMEKYLSTER